MNNTTIITTLKLSSFALFLMMVLAGCQSQNDVAETYTEAVQLSENIDCTDGSTNSFGLEQLDMSQNSSNADYGFQLVNTGGPFTLGSCVCDVIKYELTFTNVPANTIVTDQYGNPIPFSIETDPVTGNQTIVVYPETMNDATYEIHVFFDVAPALVSAGGLCVVDNLSGIGIQEPELVALHSDPVHISYIDNSFSTVHKWMIPTTMTRTIRK